MSGGLLGLLSKAMLCPHTQHSPPDEMGAAICGNCGSTVRVKFTRAGFMDAVDSVYRNFGMVSHSKRCVRLDDQRWVCADDCEMRTAKA